MAARFALVAAAAAAAAAVSSAAPCATDLDCSLNGVCGGAGVCTCDAPWAGAECAQLAFKATTPASGKSLYNATSPSNTWNGPIVFSSSDNLYHIYVPLYKAGSLGSPTTTLHGVSKTVTGPYDWASRPPLPVAAENPAAVVFTDPATSKTVVSVWLGGQVLVADSADGPFAPVAGFTYPGGNPAPIFHDGAFFMTNQGTSQVFTTPALAPGAVWAVFSNISHANLPPTTPPGQYHVEDVSMARALLVITQRCSLAHSHSRRAE